MKPVGSFNYLLRKVVRPKVVIMDGLLVHVPSSLPWGLRKSIYKDTYEVSERKLVRAALRPGDRVLELGSGIGVVSMFCASIVGSDNRLSYEANPLKTELIARNFALNGLKSNLVNRAIALRGGDIEFLQNDNIVSSSLFSRRAGKAITVPSDALNDVIGEFRPTALVLDIEGAETDLLPQADLGGIDKIVMEVHPGISGPEAARNRLAHLKAAGFASIAQSADGEVVCLSK